MELTAEISCYPLKDDYKSLIIPFIKRLNAYKDIYVESTGMNTLITGDSDKVFDVIKTEITVFLEKNKGVFVLKIVSGNRSGKRNYT